MKRRKQKRARSLDLAIAACDVALSQHPLDMFLTNLFVQTVNDVATKTEKPFFDRVAEATAQTAKQLGATASKKEEEP